jgi:hypothetical protein
MLGKEIPLFEKLSFVYSPPTTLGGPIGHY